MYIIWVYHHLVYLFAFYQNQRLKYSIYTVFIPLFVDVEPVSNLALFIILIKEFRLFRRSLEDVFRYCG